LGLLDKFLNRRGGANATMSMMEHIEALRWHIVRSVIVIIVAAIFAFININFIFDKIIIGPANGDFIAYEWFCAVGKLFHIEELCMDGVTLRFQNTQLAGQFMLSISVAFFVGFIIAFPYVFWEFWRFVKPALTDNEVKMASGIVLWSSLLFIAGVAFAYFIIAPFTIGFFATYELSEQFENIITIKNYYSTISSLIIGIGIVFELPIVVYFLSKIGFLTPNFMREKRRYAIVIILFISAIITPPDWFSMILVWMPLMLLYEISIFISAKVEKTRNKELGIVEEDEPLDW